LHAGGQRFDSVILHQFTYLAVWEKNKVKTTGFYFTFRNVVKRC